MSKDTTGKATLLSTDVVPHSPLLDGGMDLTSLEGVVIGFYFLKT